MRISFNTIFLDNNINFGHSKKTTRHQKDTALPCDSFVKSKKPNTLTFEKFMSKEDKLKISDYKTLDRADVLLLKDRLLREYNDYDKYTYAANLTIELALDLKSKLDNTYGEDGYIFVSIGQSPSLIAKVFECMGVETKYLPISDLGDEIVDIDALFEEKCVKNYKKILDMQGLTKDMTEATDKKVLFYDYTCSGQTLNIFEYFMRTAYKFPYKKTEFRSLNKDLIDCAEHGDNADEFIRVFLLDLGSSRYTSINHLPYNKISDMHTSKKNLAMHRFREVKLFNFLVMDELNKMGLLKENPANSIAL